MSGELGAFLSTRRRLLGLTQERVSAAARISRSHLSQIESGKIGLPNAETRRLLARVLAVDHIDLLVAAGELHRDEVKPRSRTHDRAWDQVLDRLDPDAAVALFEVARLMSSCRASADDAQPEHRRADGDWRQLVP